MPGAPNNVSYKNNTHILGISVHYFPKNVYGQNGCVSIIDIEETLLFNVAGLLLRNGFEDACYEHVPLVAAVE